MPPKTRTWIEGLDNFGENLIRLGAALKGLEESPGTVSTDEGFRSAIGRLASSFGLAFRQAHPVLAVGEATFLALVPSDATGSLPNLAGREDPQQAHTLVHEAILGSRGTVILLDRIARAAQANPAATRQVVQPSLQALAETTTGVGWELRAVCHEFRSEVDIVGKSLMTIKDLGPGLRGLVHDMASAARQLRAARRGWFIVDQRLAASTGVQATGP